jgi:hypothetical protein
MNALENKEVTLGENYYVITAMGATDGMVFLDKMINGMGKLPIAEMKTVIIKYVKLGGKPFTDKLYDTHFSRKYDELNKLFEEIMSFNFGDANPNDGSDTSEEKDTSE